MSKVSVDDHNLYAFLMQALPGREEVKRGRREWHTDCPWCGKKEKRGQVHFSFSEVGGHCFVCGAGGKLRAVGVQAGILEESDKYVKIEGPLPVREPVKPKAPPSWLADGWDYVREWCNHPQAQAQWEAYKPVPEEVRVARFWGWGKLPEYASRCNQERLIVPLIAGGEVLGARARIREIDALSCSSYREGLCTSMGENRPASCPKWLSAAMVRGTQPLYNGARLLPFVRRDRARRYLLGDTDGAWDARGKLLFIVENPVDAALLEWAYPQHAFVATLAVRRWEVAWSRAVVESECRVVVIAYDNDVPGNGNTPQAWAAWRADPKHRDIEPGGVALANKLLKAGAAVRLFPWGDAPVKADPATWLESGI